MKDLLSKYYSRTRLQTVYIDPMILNSRTKLMISEEESQLDIDVNEYKLASQRHSIEEYDKHSLNSRYDSNSTSIPLSMSSRSKQSQLSLANNEAYQTELLNHLSKCHRYDFDHYIEILNNSVIVDSLS